MSARSRIVNSLVDKLKGIDGAAPYKSALSGNVFNRIKFSDEISDFPTVCVISGYESREYLPSNFTWAYLNISIKVYVEGENSQELLENLLSDIEYTISQNEQLKPRSAA